MLIIDVIDIALFNLQICNSFRPIISAINITVQQSHRQGVREFRENSSQINVIDSETSTASLNKGAVD